MSQRIGQLRQLAAVGTLCLLGACAQTGSQSAASNPPPVPPGASATWYHIEFDTGSRTLDSAGMHTVADITRYMQTNPQTIATIIGKTDTVGSGNYNMHLSHLRADTVRDALVYNDHVAADRVETRWTGETREHVATGNGVAEAANRVVDVALH